MNENLKIEWKCTCCETVNECAIKEAKKKHQRCIKCNKPHYVDVQFNIGAITEVEFTKK